MFTIPRRCASWASSTSPVYCGSIVLPRPIILGSCQQEPSAGISTRRIKVSDIRAFSEAGRMSQDSAIPIPRPMACPLTAAMEGF